METSADEFNGDQRRERLLFNALHDMELRRSTRTKCTVALSIMDTMDEWPATPPEIPDMSLRDFVMSVDAADRCLWRSLRLRTSPAPAAPSSKAPDHDEESKDSSRVTWTGFTRLLKQLFIETCDTDPHGGKRLPLMVQLICADTHGAMKECAKEFFAAAAALSAEEAFDELDKQSLLCICGKNTLSVRSIADHVRIEFATVSKQLRDQVQFVVSVRGRMHSRTDEIA